MAEQTDRPQTARDEKISKTQTEHTMVLLNELTDNVTDTQANATLAQIVCGTYDGYTDDMIFHRGDMKRFNVSDLLDSFKARQITNQIMAKIKAYKSQVNDARAQDAENATKNAKAVAKNPDAVKDVKPRMLSTRPSENVPMAVVVEAMLATGDFKALDEPLNDNLKACRYLMRRYENGKPTGIWDIIDIDSKNIPKAIYKVITNMCGILTERQTGDYVNAVKSSFFTRLPKATNELKKFNYKAIPCRNGVFDKIEGDDRPRFTAWTDTDSLNEIYGEDFAFTWSLRVDYKPDAECPEYRDPFDVIDSVFDTTKQIGKSSANVVKQGIQFSARGFSGGTGHIVWYCNDSHCAGGSNGKSTIMDLDKSLFTDGSPSDMICTANMADLFSGDFGSSQLVDKVVYMGDEQDKTLDDTGAFKNFVRGQDVPVQRKYLPNIMIRCPGYKVQCLNELPKMAGKNMAIYRGNIFLKLEKNFAEGSPDRDPYLISDYVWQTDVAEYILSQICDMPFVDDYSQDDISAIECNKWDVISNNDTAVEAVQTLLNGFNGARMVPAKYIYNNLYPNWCREAFGKDTGAMYKVSYKHFINAAIELSNNGLIDYEYVGKTIRIPHALWGDLDNNVLPALDEYGRGGTSGAMVNTRTLKADDGFAEPHNFVADFAMEKQWTGMFIRKDYYIEHYTKDDDNKTA